MTSLWRLTRSAAAPPRGAKMNTGICEAKPMEPSRTEDPVIRYTSHDSAIVCIHVPISETSWPVKNNWKLRCFNARKVVFQRDASELLTSEVDPIGRGLDARCRIPLRNLRQPTQHKSGNHRYE